jgi:hypothetical protein
MYGTGRQEEFFVMPLFGQKLLRRLGFPSLSSMNITSYKGASELPTFSACFHTRKRRTTFLIGR